MSQSDQHPDRTAGLFARLRSGRSPTSSTSEEASASPDEHADPDDQRIGATSTSAPTPSLDGPFSVDSPGDQAEDDDRRGTEPPLRWRISAETKRCRIDPTGPTMREPFRSRLLTAAKRSLRKRARPVCLVCPALRARLAYPELRVRPACPAHPAYRARPAHPTYRARPAHPAYRARPVRTSPAPTSAPTRKLTPTFSLPGSGLLIGAGPGPSRRRSGADSRAQPASVGPDPESPPARHDAETPTVSQDIGSPEDPRSLHPRRTPQPLGVRCRPTRAGGHGACIPPSRVGSPRAPPSRGSEPLAAQAGWPWPIRRVAWVKRRPP